MTASDPPARPEDLDEPTTPLRPLAEGRYVDFTPVGEGGMGIVYWAVDSDLKRQVAFKIVRPPTDTATGNVTPPVPFALRAPTDQSGTSEAYDHLTARFLQEAWVTGGMEHPGIVPVYELGRTEAGIPYYTMKFVRGNRTLTTAIDEHRDEALDERLKLLDPFLKVCDTMRYAHSRGVIHRDLKPDNIGLGDFGEVVVLDWGLAKLAEEGQSQLSRWQGEVHAFRDEGKLETMPSAVGTPGYMAPEAALGLTDALDERCDVYSLGVILFELLTGQLPVRCDNFRDYQERLAKEQAADATSIRADVPGGLAEICRDALRRELGQRTATVDALSQAVRAWQDRRVREREIDVLFGEAESGLHACLNLTGEALSTQADRVVIACQRVKELDPDHAGAHRVLGEAEAARERGIRERERVARTKTLRKAIAVGLAVAAVGAGLAAWMLDRRRQEAEDARAVTAQARSRAVSDRERAEDVMAFMVGDLQESLQAIGRLDVLARLGQEARTYFERIPEEDVTPLSLQNGARALLNLGEVHNNLGDLPAAMRTFEAAQKTVERLPNDETGRALRNDVRARIAHVLIKQGFYHRALALLEPFVNDPDGDAAVTARRRVAVAEAHALLGLAHAGTLDVEEALPHFQKAIASARALAREAPEDAERQAVLVRYLLSQRRSFLLAGTPEKLQEIADDTETLVATWRAKAPKDVRWLRWEADVSITRGTWEQWGNQDLAQARKHYAKALATYDQLHEIDSLNATYLSTVGFLEGRLGATTDDTTASLTHWKRSYDIQEQLVSKDPTNAVWLHRMVNLADPIETVVLAAGGNRAATRSYREAAVTYAKRLVAVDKDNPLARHLHAYALNRYASFLEPAEAAKQYEKVVALCEDVAAQESRSLPELGVLAHWAAGSLFRIDATQGQVLVRRAVALLDRAIALGPHSATIQYQLATARIEARLRLVDGLAGSGDLQQARDHVAADRAWLADRIERALPDDTAYLKALDAQLAKRESELEAGGR